MMKYCNIFNSSRGNPVISCAKVSYHAAIALEHEKYQILKLIDVAGRRNVWKKSSVREWQNVAVPQ